jgi:basic membrane protein A
MRGSSRTLVLGLLLVTALVVSCKSSTPTPAPTAVPAASAAESAAAYLQGKSVAVVFAPSGLGDRSLNDSLFAGMVLITNKYAMTWNYVEPLSYAEEETILSNYARTGKYLLIVCNGQSCGTSMDAAAKEFPNQKFLIIDTVSEAPNVAGYLYAKQDSSYLAGIAAGMLTKTNKLGFVGAFDIPIIEKGLAGFKAGALSVNPKVEVTDGYVGAWDNIQGSQEMALSMKQQGADVIYHNASAGGLGVIEASKTGGFIAIGYDSNQNDLSPDTVALSALRDMSKSVEHCLLKMAAGEFPAGQNELGVKDNAVFVTNDFSNIKLDPAIWDKINAAEDAMRAGTLKAPTTMEEIK